MAIRRIGTSVQVRPQSETHLARSIDRFAPRSSGGGGEREESLEVVDVLAARVSRCASRPDEFAHGRTAPAPPSGFPALNLHFICLRSGCPLFWHAQAVDACVRAHVERMRVAGALRATITRSDGCAERSALSSLDFNETDARWHALRRRRVGHCSLWDIV